MEKEPICEITCSVISWYGCYYITLLLINISSYLFLFLPEEQNVLEVHPFLSSVLLLLTLLLAKAGAYYGLFQTADASGLAAPRRKL